jgi:hypothetical protein
MAAAGVGSVPPVFFPALFDEHTLFALEVRIIDGVDGRGICNQQPFHLLPVIAVNASDWDWYDICAHLKCSRCGSVEWVDPRPNWSEVVNYNQGISGR